MLREKVTVNFEIGLDARAAAMLLRNSIKFDSDIFLIKDKNKYNAKSILNILSMEAKNNDTIELEINGPDEKEAMIKLKEFFKKNQKELYTI
ncbi:hypothetical protein HMPREF3188_01232 [Tissierellia bacterium KA00581]|jgi:hypothetical protein|nr:hypothetical protein HMPREF3188_01232 [Tissierellia bacterium KA00581]